MKYALILCLAGCMFVISSCKPDNPSEKEADTTLPETKEPATVKTHQLTDLELIDGLPYECTNEWDGDKSATTNRTGQFSIDVPHGWFIQEFEPDNGKAMLIADTTIDWGQAITIEACARYDGQSTLEKSVETEYAKIMNDPTRYQLLRSGKSTMEGMPCYWFETFSLLDREGRRNRGHTDVTYYFQPAGAQKLYSIVVAIYSENVAADFCKVSPLVKSFKPL